MDLMMDRWTLRWTDRQTKKKLGPKDEQIDTKNL